MSAGSFTGNLHVAEKGAKARFYSLNLNRWSQPDTMTPASPGPQGLNRFSYANNNPLNYVDPTGHVPACMDTFGCKNVSPEDAFVDSGNSTSNDKDKQKEKSEESEGDPQTDVTEYLANELSSELNWLEENSWSCIQYLECVGHGGYFPLLLSHQGLFGNHQRYDIKRGMLEDIGAAVTLCGDEGCLWADYSAPGNILFGYLSAARGVNQVVAHAAGGILESKDNGEINWDYASSGFDNPGDKAAVDFGYYLYEKYPNGISFDELQSELTMSVLESFQAPESYPTNPPVQQTNSYEAGHFLNP